MFTSRKGHLRRMGHDESPDAITQANEPMRLFKADFYRTFAIGFGLGAVMVFTVMDGGNDSVVPSAIAAPTTAQ
jgi:hypothetical protein